MAGLPESMLATFAFGFRDPGTFPQVITTDDPSITPSVDAIPMDDTETTNTSKDEMLERIQRTIMSQFHLVSWRSKELFGMYTSAFVEPLTKEIFLSGDLVKPSTATHHKGLVWYDRKEDAEDAAYARCLDCAEMREAGSPRQFGLRVKEPPYLLGKGIPLPSSIPQDIKSRLGVEFEVRDVDTMATGLSGEISSITPDDHASATTTATSTPRARSKGSHPISMLNEHYQKLGVVTLAKNFVAWRHGEAHIPKFTGAFVCPMSGEIFFSGRWMGCDDGSIEMDGLQWYTTKKKAQAAAAAVAHDCLCFRNHPSGLNPRFCMEDPYREGSKLQQEIVESIPFEHKREIQDLQRKAKC